MANFLLNSKRFQVRALTRDVNGAAAKSLASRGASVVATDLNSRESLRNAFQGIDGLFGTTVTPQDSATEERHGKLVADVALECRVKHVVWSTLEDVKKITGGRYEVPHFDAKAHVGEYMKSKGLPLTEGSFESTDSPFSSSGHVHQHIREPHGSQKGRRGVRVQEPSHGRQNARSCRH